jgi:hypothetical protein
MRRFLDILSYVFFFAGVCLLIGAVSHSNLFLYAVTVLFIAVIFAIIPSKQRG